jgi:hypothetical protein
LTRRVSGQRRFRKVGLTVQRPALGLAFPIGERQRLARTIQPDKPKPSRGESNLLLSSSRHRIVIGAH